MHECSPERRIGTIGVSNPGPTRAYETVPLKPEGTPCPFSHSQAHRPACQIGPPRYSGDREKDLQAHGGWSDFQTPFKIYAQREASYAKEEAKEVRGTIRGEDEE